MPPQIHTHRTAPTFPIPSSPIAATAPPTTLNTEMTNGAPVHSFKDTQTAIHNRTSSFAAQSMISPGTRQSTRFTHSTIYEYMYDSSEIGRLAFYKSDQRNVIVSLWQPRSSTRHCPKPAEGIKSRCIALRFDGYVCAKNGLVSTIILVSY